MKRVLASPLHRVLGLFLSDAIADSARRTLMRRGLPADRIRLLSAAATGGRHPLPVHSDHALQDILRGAAIGTALGTLAGMAGGAALAASQFTLFIASPVLSALTLMGWGASLGGAAGALAGSQGRQAAVADLVRDALTGGHVAVLVSTWTESETDLARQVLATAMEAQAVKPLLPAALVGRRLAAP